MVGGLAWEGSWDTVVPPCIPHPGTEPHDSVNMHAQVGSSIVARLCGTTDAARAGLRGSKREVEACSMGPCCSLLAYRPRGGK
jgi:hypothetical protein